LIEGLSDLKANIECRKSADLAYLLLVAVCSALHHCANLDTFLNWRGANVSCMFARVCRFVHQK